MHLVVVPKQLESTKRTWALCKCGYHHWSDDPDPFHSNGWLKAQFVQLTKDKDNLNKLCGQLQAVISDLHDELDRTRREQSFLSNIKKFFKGK